MLAYWLSHLNQFKKRGIKLQERGHVCSDPSTVLVLSLLDDSKIRWLHRVRRGGATSDFVGVPC